MQDDLSVQAPVEPVIYARQDHPISRRHIDRDALKVLYRLKNHGYLAYMVGGSIRDICLGKEPKDFDVATDARPEEMRRMFRNCRIIGRRFRLAHVYFHGGKIIEVSTFRRSVFNMDDDDSENADEDDETLESVDSDDDDFDGEDDEPAVEARPPDNGPAKNGNGAPCDENVFGSPCEDAFRRDITINALFYNIADFSIIDYVGGMKDLEKGIVRAVGCPHRSFAEDPVRMIRVLRHASKTRFDIDPKTYDAIAENAEKICTCSPARVREEFLRELRGGWSTQSFRLMERTDLLRHLFEDYRDILSEGEGCATREHLFRNLEGTDKLINRGEAFADPMLLAAFVSPFVAHAKVQERAPEGRGRMRFYHNEVREVIKPVVKNFGFSKRHAESISQAIIGKLALDDVTRESENRGFPKQMLRKNYFLDGYTLFRIECAGDARPVPDYITRAAKKAMDFRREKSPQLLTYTGQNANGHAASSRPRRRRRGPRRDDNAPNARRAGEGGRND
ncbi:MAG: polynucleotide adenylyltransferase PcnB [Deltaproteobacteria bacterium]|nr:polynucleotide adenylyltransferase PcnB [Deltaproteobacteria bacterium]